MLAPITFSLLFSSRDSEYFPTLKKQKVLGSSLRCPLPHASQCCHFHNGWRLYTVPHLRHPFPQILSFP